MKIKKVHLIVISWFLIAGIGGATSILAGMYLYLSPQLPDVETLKEVRLQTPLRIYSADGKLMGEFGEKRRIPVKYADIPEQYIHALLSAEDAQFYSHNGVSIKGLLRATTQLITTGRRGQGGSTITMQVARNFFLSRRKTFARKFNEILLALKIEQELTKEEILELYVNVIFLGKRAYGIEAAAHVYYGKPLSELSLAQLAMIAGLPQGPSTQNPIANPVRAIERRNWILKRMLKLDYIDENTYQQAINEPVTAKYHSKNLEVNAPYVAEMARKKVVEQFGLTAYTEGYRVYTTIKSTLQNTAQEAVIKGLLTYDERHGYRGPEQQLLTAEEASTFNTLPQDEQELQIQQWLENVESIPEYGGLEAAVVTSVGEKNAKTLLGNGTEVELAWEDGIAQARRFQTENVLGPKPQNASDVLQIGDIVRLELKERASVNQEAEEQPRDRWYLRQVPDAQAALVSLSPKNGALLSLVGGFDFKQSHFNRAIQAKRQPGSNFKPFIYTSALESGLTAATIINDAPIVVNDEQLEGTWRPVNSSRKFYGPTRLREALYRSRNLVSIKVMQSVGIGQTIRQLNQLGFDTSEMPRDLSLALGSHSLTPLEVARGYAVLANGGYQVEPYFIERIIDFEGNSLFEALPQTVCKTCEEEPDQIETPELADDTEQTDVEFFSIEFDEDAFEFDIDTKVLLDILEPQDYPQAPKVINDRVAYIIDSMLKDVIQRGTGVKAKVIGRRDLAGKTGTTNGPIDAWFSGYGGQIVTTTWVGFDQNSLLGLREYGGSAALPIWIDFMKVALKDVPETKRLQPEGIVTVKIDPETGKRARADDPDAIFEIFREENVPEQSEAAANSESYSPYEDEEALTEELFN